METGTIHARILSFLLRLGGGFMLLAFGAVFMPTAWMETSHRVLGLGAFPATPLVDYLTRSISALYGFHGGMLLVVASDVRRHARIVTYLGVMNVLFGVMIVGIDLHAGLPAYWTLMEGPPVLAFGLVVLYLIRKVDAT